MTDKYTILELDLTAAGAERVEGPWELMRFLDAVDGGGNVIATAKIRVRAGRDEEDKFPLRIGNAVRLKPATKTFFLDWDAQAGVVATFGFSADGEQVDWDSDPPGQVTTITGTVATEETKAATLTGSGDNAITTATTETVAANTARRELFVQAADGNTGSLFLRDDAGNAFAELLAGQAITIATTAAVQVRNDSGASQTYRTLEVAD